MTVEPGATPVVAVAEAGVPTSSPAPEDVAASAIRPPVAVAAPIIVAPRARLEDIVENTLFGVFAYVGRAWITTRDALRHPLRFARQLPSDDYCRPTTYFVIAVFLETWLGTTLIALQRPSADSVYDKRTTAGLSQALGHGAVGGDWSSLLLMLAPLIGVAALFAACLHVFGWRRHALDFQRSFGLTCYAIAAPTYVRVALLATILPVTAAAGRMRAWRARAMPCWSRWRCCNACRWSSSWRTCATRPVPGAPRRGSGRGRHAHRWSC